MRRLITALVIAVATLPTPARAASVPVLVVDGRGFGHGVGMAQDGAYWMGVAGARTDQILGQFYPGTSIGKGQGPVRVVVGDAGPAPSSVLLAFPSGGQLRDARTGEQSPGFPVEMKPGERARIVWDGGRYRVERFGGPVALGRATLTGHRRSQVVVPTTTTTEPGSTTTTTAPPDPVPTTTTSPPTTTTTNTTTTQPLVPGATTTTPSPSEPSPPDGEPAPSPGQPSEPPAEQVASARSIWATPQGNGAVEMPDRQRRYRGLLEATGAGGALRVINEVDVETYLKGMGEVRDPRWPPAALRAQAIAARTYALRAMLVGGGEICDTQRCQVYLGAHAEYGAMNKAVDDTRGQVIAYGRGLASAVYSANGGGFSASREEGFGVPEDRSAPYLRAAPYPTQDPLPWSVTVALDAAAARLGYRGQITNVVASKTGPSGRVLEVTLDGSAGPKVVAGIAFDAALGLKSTLFTVRVGVSDVAPPPLPPAELLIQSPPEQAAAIAAPATTTVERASRSRTVPRIDLSPTRPGDGTGDEVAKVFGAWAAFALLCAGAIVISGRRGRPVQLAQEI